MKAQITLTVAEAKALIAQAIANLPEVHTALADGRILLKGGTTVAAVALLLSGESLRISGRISPRGAKATRGTSTQAHSLLLENGKSQNIDESFGAAVGRLRPGDVVIIGANALDSSGQAALMLGRPLGGNVGQGLAGIMSQGCRVIIACGLEKLIPGSIAEAIRVSGIYSADWSLGMAAGLAPLSGEVITEQKALELISGAKCTVITAGGIDGAEGATTMVAEGDETAVKKAVQAVLGVRGAVTAGCPESLIECDPGSPGCAVHQTCAWRTARGGEIKWREK